MASVASQLIGEVAAHVQSDSLEDAREICADGTYFPNNLSICRYEYKSNSPLVQKEESHPVLRLHHHYRTVTI